jgi:hypothetical protein
MQVLILGNGLSRLSFDKQICAYKGEIWGCNRIYLDYADVLTLLTGHTEVQEEAKKYRAAHNCKFRIIGENGDEPVTCPEIYRKDSGTTLVAEALYRGYEVEICGFDLGGLDVYSPGQQWKNKSSWISRWRLILEKYGAGHVTFWGYDHKPFILSGKSPREYYNKYSKGAPHIDTPEYMKVFTEWAGDYSHVLDAVPCVLLQNKGKREFTILETGDMIKDGQTVKLPEMLAQKYVDAYRRDFRILPLPESLDCNIIKQAEGI